MSGHDLAGRPRTSSVGSGGPLPARAVVGTALLVGGAADVLVRSPEGPGLNVPLFFAVVALALAAVSRRAGRRPSPEAWGWIAAGLVLASGFALRASPVLQLLAFLAAAAAFTLPALRAGRAWIVRSGVSDQVEAVVAATAWAGLGALRLVAGGLGVRDGSQGPVSAGRSSGGLAAARGVLLAAPLLLVFGALFISADRVFAGLVNNLVGRTLEVWASHAVVTAVLAWLAAGYLTGFLTGTRVRGLVEGRIRRPSIGIVEAGVALGLVDLLFAAFVAVQFRYLFGGADLVQVTPGLTYAEYAREGFGQLAVASALVLPVLLGMDWLLHPRTVVQRYVFRGLGGLQLLLLGVVMASAFQRVAAYRDAYGLTESRLYGAVFLAWLGLVGIGFATTVLRGRRDRFAFPMLLSGVAVVAGLHLANPDARIARSNLDRAVLDEGGEALDVAYLASLSADAVPTLLDALPRLPAGSGCILARRLLERWGDGGTPGWRGWNLSVVRAREGVASAAPALGATIEGSGGCPDEPGAR